MKRIVVVVGVVAAMAAAPSVASAGAAQSRSSPQRAARPPAHEASFQSVRDGRSGDTLYRLGNSGLWME